MSESAFLKQLEAEPDDDTTRLVYADWLDEHDDLRGEFLRTWVLLRTADEPQRSEYRQRILELRPIMATGWLARALPDVASDEVREALFRVASGGGKRDVFFLAVCGGDPSWYLFARLKPDYPHLRPWSEVRDEAEEYLRGFKCCFGPVFWDNHNRCRTEVDTTVAPMGSGTECRVELQNEEWAITDTRGTWIS